MTRAARHLETELSRSVEPADASGPDRAPPRAAPLRARCRLPRLVAGLLLLTTGLAGLVTTPCAGAEHTDPYGVAVIIGNRTYARDDGEAKPGRAIPAAEFAHRDAEAFRRYVLDVLGFNPDNVIDLRDATQAQMEAAFGNERSHKGRLWRYLHPRHGSDVVVFYSGHGVPGLKDRRGYLLPADADPDSVEINGFPLDLLYENLGRLEAAKSVRVYLDACFSGDSDRGMLVRSANPVYVQAALPEVAGDRLTVLAAASGTEVASWDNEARHGLFTHHLLDALYGAGDADGDGTVTATEAKTYLDDTMTIAARREYGREQNASLTGMTGRVLASTGVGGRFPQRPELPEAPAASAPGEAASKAANVTETPAPVAGVKDEPAVPSPEEVERALVLTHGQRELVQHGLVSLGYEIGRVDGVLGARSRAGIGAYQTEKGLEPTGRLAAQVSEALQTLGRRHVEEVRAERERLERERLAREKAERVRASREPGRRFRDCEGNWCPELVVVRSGSYMMGSPGSEEGRRDNEGPGHRVTLAKPFAVGVHEVTRGQWRRFVEETGHSTGNVCWGYEGGEWKKRSDRSWRHPGYSQTDGHPVVCVSWEDARAYVRWLSRETGKRYRLLSESEWEYVARGGTSTARYWGEGESGQCRHANGADTALKARYSDWKWAVVSCRDGHVHTSPVGSFSANGFGLYDVLGNVWEWVEDCWHESYHVAPSDGSAWTVGGDCSRQVLRGGSWINGPLGLRSAFRGWFPAGDRDSSAGFRVARTLN